MTLATEKAEALARLSREQLLLILEHLPYAMGVFDADLRYVYYNPAGEVLSGVPLSQGVGKTSHEILPPMVAQRVQPILEDVRANLATVHCVLDLDFGQGLMYMQLVFAPLLDTTGKFTGILGITEDVTKEKMYEQQLIGQANHDALTGLANRLLLRRLVEEETRAAQAENHKFAFLFLDRDNFKNINDFYGHAFGDELLRLVADRIGNIAEKDRVARIGGDEFAVLQARLASPRDAEEFAAKIHGALAQPFLIDEQEITISTSIGIAFFPDHGRDLDQLMKNADVALYKAKKKGKGQSRFFNEELNTSTVRRLKLEHLLSGALARGEFSLAYQPIANFKDNKVIGCEALLRWSHSELGNIGPDEFIPIAENGGMLPPIADFVLTTALASLEKLAASRADFYISVNLSPVHFQNRGLIKTIAAALEHAKIPPRRLQLEITESVFLDSALETVYILDGLHALGVRLALDDFGTGYSSLNYLTRFPFHCLKIDKSFIQGIVTTGREREVARAIIQMAKALELNVVAEGIEHQPEYEILSQFGCDGYQGYLLSRPVPLAEWRW